MLFLFEKEIKAHVKLLKSKSKKLKKKSDRDLASLTQTHLNLLLKYLDEDYKDIKKELRNMLKIGSISFELVWALYKPGSIACGHWWDTIPVIRCVRVVDINRIKKTVYGVTQNYWQIGYDDMDYDGESFGSTGWYGYVEKFEGYRKVTRLDYYPVRFHDDEAALRAEMIERGKRLVTLVGACNLHYNGTAYIRIKEGLSRKVLKVSVDERVVVDQATFRRINPNYEVNWCEIRDETVELVDDLNTKKDKYRPPKDLNVRLTRKDSTRNDVWKLFKKDGKHVLVELEVNERGQARRPSADYQEPFTDGVRNFQSSFTETELLIMSPVVLGFALKSKVWAEFTTNALTEIEWKENAFQDMVLADDRKRMLTSLLVSHGLRSDHKMGDIVKGKGKGRTPPAQILLWNLHQSDGGSFRP